MFVKWYNTAATKKHFYFCLFPTRKSINIQKVYVPSQDLASSEFFLPDFVHHTEASFPFHQGSTNISFSYSHIL